MAQAIFGRLFSFGGLNYQDTASPIYPVRTGWPKEFAGEYEQGLVGVGHTYPYDSFGLEAAPLRSATLTYEVALVAATGLTDGQALSNLRTRYNLIWAASDNTYTWAGITGVSGQKGDLIVSSEDESVATLYSATARLISPPNFQLVAGQPSYMTIDLKFALLSSFNAVL